MSKGEHRGGTMKVRFLGRLMRPIVAACCAIFTISVLSAGTPRSAKDEADLRFWLENMVWHHGFAEGEISAVTGLSGPKVRDALRRFDISQETRPSERTDMLLVLPYPGGRHPRVGFLDGAVDPQRETKVSVFTPWDPCSYVVVDVPEAIWSHQGLLYLAHTHVPTIWTKAGVALDPLEWTRHRDGSLSIKRVLPNKVEFGAFVRPETNWVAMELWLTNKSAETWRDMRVQNCVMLKGATGFEQQTNANKTFQSPYVACRSDDGTKWVITAWHSSQRVWANPPVPCLHSDPKFPDCAPGEGSVLRGWLSFYEGTNITAEFARIERTGWREFRR